jgi:hypothetical protein
MSENVGASTSCNPRGLHGLYRENFTLPINPGKIQGKMEHSGTSGALKEQVLRLNYYSCSQRRRRRRRR